jgi:hypothetical protein
MAAALRLFCLAAARGVGTIYCAHCLFLLLLPLLQHFFFLLLPQNRDQLVSAIFSMCWIPIVHDVPSKRVNRLSSNDNMIVG